MLVRWYATGTDGTTDSPSPKSGRRRGARLSYPAGRGGLLPRAGAPDARRRHRAAGRWRQQRRFEPPALVASASAVAADAATIFRRVSLRDEANYSSINNNTRCVAGQTKVAQKNVTAMAGVWRILGK